MARSRLTGLELYWFDKGQVLVTRCKYGEAMDLDKLTIQLAAAITDDAGASSAGAESLRRVAARFSLDASGIAKAADEEPATSPLERVVAARRSKALRGLASSFERAAVEFEKGVRTDLP
jgi:hypothetical protein